MKHTFNFNVWYFFQAGNVVTGEMVEELILSGADIIKVRILYLLCLRTEPLSHLHGVICGTAEVTLAATIWAKTAR